MFERTEHEPDEYDPEEEFHDPESDSLTIPSVETNDDVTDAPAAVQRPFWTLVFVLKGAVLMTALGVLLLAFEYDRTSGISLLAAGVAFFLLAGRRILRFRDQVAHIERTAAESDEDGTEDVDAAANEEETGRTGAVEGEGEGESEDDGTNATVDETET